ncbi:MAG: glycosyltransferase, partial [Ardenticatenales bacterium]
MSAASLLYRPDIGPVLIASGGEGATRRYRAFHHAEQLELAGVPARVAPRIDAALAAEAPRWPIVLLHRVAWDGAVQALIDRTRDGGGIVLFDVDDLVFEPESTRWHHGVQALTPAEQALYHQGVRRYRRTLLACDAAIVPTAALAARVERAGRPALISRNCLDDELLRLSARAAAMAAARSAHDPRGTVHHGGDDPIVVGYASGTRTHDRDFSAACGPALRRVMGRHPHVRLQIIGPLALDDGWSPFLDRVMSLESVGWRDLPALLAGFDINVAPLEVDNLFCQCKSELKWLEAAACGRPTVASATQAFADALSGARGDEAGERFAGVDGVDARDGGVDGRGGGRGIWGGDVEDVPPRSFRPDSPPSTPLGLLATTVDEWEAALESLVVDAARREAIGGAAARWVAAERTTHAQAGAFVQTLMKVMESGRSNFSANDEAAHGASPAPPVRRVGGRASAVRVDRASTSEREAVRPGAAAAAPSDAPRRGAADRLTIKVLVPEPPPGSGGHTSIFRMVAALCDAGHDVAVHIDRGPLMQRISEREAERYIGAHFPPSPATIRLGRDLGPADVAIATGWTTAAVAAWAPDIGTRLYFVQDYEPFFQPLSADYVAAAQTYRLGLGHITLGPWLAVLIESRFDGRARPID